MVTPALLLQEQQRRQFTCFLNIEDEIEITMPRDTSRTTIKGRDIKKLLENQRMQRLVGAQTSFQKGQRQLTCEDDLWKCSLN